MGNRRIFERSNEIKRLINTLKPLKMTRKEFLLKTLYKIPSLNSKSLTDKYYEKCEAEVEKKRRAYIAKGAEKTEKELKNQIRAELQSHACQLNKENLINIIKIENKQNYSLTDEGRQYYEDHYLETEIPEEDVEVIVEEYEENENIGIVYLLKSKTFDDTYKVGMTKLTMNERLNNLRSDNRYGLFNFIPVMYMKCMDYQIIERVLHKFFENYRLCKKNDLRVDTELFKDIDSIEIEFELFAKYLKSNPRFKDEVELIHC